MVGYFKVPESSKSKKGFKASESVLLPKSKSIAIGYASRGVPTSWGNSKSKDDIYEIFEKLKSLMHEDISELYQEETKNIMNMLTTQSGAHKLINTCNECTSNKKKQCFWGRKSEKYRRRKIEDLYSRKENC